MGEGHVVANSSEWRMRGYDGWFGVLGSIS